jgi:hypothetical protein
MPGQYGKLSLGVPDVDFSKVDSDVVGAYSLLLRVDISGRCCVRFYCKVHVEPL